MGLDHLAECLSILLERGYLPASRLGSAAKKSLRPLFDAGVLEEVRAGAGRRVMVRDRAAVGAFARSRYPSGLTGHAHTSLPARAEAVAHFADAKRARPTGLRVMLLRGFGDAVLTSGDAVLPVSEWTRTAGVAAICFRDRIPWTFKGRIAVVENMEVFLHFEALNLPAEIVIYAGGRLAAAVIDWLASPLTHGSPILYLGDYDPVGMDEYLRLKKACGERVGLFIPAEIERLFAKYGKRQLVSDSTAILKRLRREDDPDLKRIVSLMDRHGAGLEQEALILNQERCDIGAAPGINKPG